MNCRDLAIVIEPFLYGELEPNARAEAEAHLAACQACADLLRQEMAFHQALGSASREAASFFSAPERLRARIRQGIRTADRRQTGLQYAWATAAAAVSGVGATETAHVVRSRDRRSALRQMATYHLRQVRPDLQDPSPEVAQAFVARELGQNLPLFTFRNVALRGVRLWDRMAQAVYETPDGHVMSVFHAGDLDRETPLTPSIETANGYNVVVWREDETVYTLVSDLNEQDIMALLRAKAGATGLSRTPLTEDRQGVPACFKNACAVSPLERTAPTWAVP
jgi:anti-sigma factor RsiW